MNVVFDLDGVLVDVRSYAEKYLVNREDWILTDKKDWREYFKHTLEFPPIAPMVEFVRTFISARCCHTIYFVTGRPEHNRKPTEAWLRVHLFRGVPRCDSFLFMRDNGDTRSTAEVKLDLLKDVKVDLVFEDDSIVVMEMLKKGYTVVQVHGFRYNTSDLIPPK